MARSKPVSIVRPQLSMLIDELAAGGDPIEITQKGQARAVLMSATDYDNIIETLEILSDREAVKGIRAGLADLTHGRLHTHDEAFSE